LQNFIASPMQAWRVAAFGGEAAAIASGNNRKSDAQSSLTTNIIVTAHAAFRRDAAIMPAILGWSIAEDRALSGSIKILRGHIAFTPRNRILPPPPHSFNGANCWHRPGVLMCFLQHPLGCNLLNQSWIVTRRARAVHPPRHLPHLQVIIWRGSQQLDACLAG